MKPGIPDHSARIERLTDAQRVRLYRLARRRLGARTTERPAQGLIAFFTTTGAGPATDELEARVSRRLPAYARPQRFVRVESLPRLPNGKLDREALIALAPSIPSAAKHEPVTVDERAADGTVSEIRQIVEAFRVALGRPDAGPDSNFFDLGGHSLLVIECILEIERATGVRIPTATFFRHPTPAALGLHVVASEPAGTSTFVYPVREAAGSPPIFVFSASRLAYTLKDVLAPNVPIYGLHLRWLDDSGRPIEYTGLADAARRMSLEIERVARGRRFILAGSSFPGTVAFEVAQQLAARGIAPLVTMLFEPTPPSSPQGLVSRDLDRLEMTENIERGHPILTWLRLHHPLTSRFWRRLRTLLVEIPKAELRCRLAHRQAARGGVVPADLELEYSDWRVHRLWSDYAPEPLGGKVVLITSDEHHLKVAPNWSSLLPADIRSHRLGCSHTELLRDPTMSRLVIPVVLDELRPFLAGGRA